MEPHKLYIVPVEAHLLLIHISIWQPFVTFLLRLLLFRIVYFIKVLIRVKYRIDVVLFHQFVEVFFSLALFHSLHYLCLFFVLTFEPVIPVLSARRIKAHNLSDCIQFTLHLLTEGHVGRASRMALQHSLRLRITLANYAWDRVLVLYAVEVVIVDRFTQLVTV